MVSQQQLRMENSTIWRKIQKQKISLEQLTDIGFRVIVKSVELLQNSWSIS